MLESLRTRAGARRKAGEIYGAVVARARAPHFYAGLGVPDTPSGRYEMVTLHLFLVLERLRTAGDTSALPRLIVEAFVIDMDDSLRELGTGDLSVPKKVNRAAAGLYERTLAYRAALAQPDDRKLSAIFIEHAYAGTAHPGVEALARYFRDATVLLAGSDVGEAIAAGRAFPPLNHPAGEAA